MPQQSSKLRQAIARELAQTLNINPADEQIFKEICDQITELQEKKRRFTMTFVNNLLERI